MGNLGIFLPVKTPTFAPGFAYPFASIFFSFSTPIKFSISIEAVGSLFAGGIYSMHLISNVSPVSSLGDRAIGYDI